jgi:tripartite-type tricarboxylate transporter receptor subunit TctC
MIAPFSPGGATDLIARLVAQNLSARLGTSVVVENRAGGGGTIATRAAAGADPDGYTLLVATNGPFAIGPAIYRNVGYDPTKSFAPIAFLASAPDVVVVRPDLPAKTLQQLIAYAQANPGNLRYGSGLGTPPHVIGEWLKAKTGSNILYVPHRGGAPALTDLLGGHTQIGIEIMHPLLPYIQEGKLRALAITSATRRPELPDVPTLAESGFPGQTFSAWFGLVAPAGTPPDVIAKLNAAVNESLSSEQARLDLGKIGFASNIGSPQDFAAYIAQEMGHWADVVQTAGIKID